MADKNGMRNEIYTREKKKASMNRNAWNIFFSVFDQCHDQNSGFFFFLLIIFRRIKPREAAFLKGKEDQTIYIHVYSMYQILYGYILIRHERLGRADDVDIYSLSFCLDQTFQNIWA